MENWNGTSGWITTTSTSSGSTLTYPVVTSSAWTTGSPVYVTGPSPRPQTPLEWLDAEIEKTCALARSAG